MTIIKQTAVIIFAFSLFSSCKKDVDPVFIIPASTGSQVQLNGLAGTEAGSSAGNSVFADLSTDKQTAIIRTSWDLGFNCGSDFRVILNNTTTAAGKVLAKNDLTQVNAADTTGMVLSFSQTAPSVAEFTLLDDIAGDITKTLIPAVSSTDADNKVIIINRGVGGGTPARAWKKIRILRSATGYTLQYAGISDVAFKTVSISKDASYNFRYVSFDDGAVANAEPQKTQWDIEWTYGVYKTSFGAGDVPYSFSDLVFINNRGGVQAAEVLAATVTYDAYKESNISSTTFSSDRDVIGSKWRATTGTIGVKTDRFYVIKDVFGNVYKLKFLSFISQDGGTRGKPVIKYELVKKG